MRVSTNTGLCSRRQLGYAFGGYAVGTANPNTLHSNTPSKNDAMGVVDENEIVSFIHDNASTRTFTVYYWDQLVNSANAAQGWVELGPSSNIYSSPVDPFANASFTLRHNLLIFLVADQSVQNLWVGGAAHYPGNTTADLSGGLS